jgi:hypothetical protein
MSVSGQLKPATHSEQRYFNEQGGLGQQPGAGAVSATAEDVPKAKSSSVVTTILRTVLFMFSPVVDSTFWAKA